MAAAAGTGPPTPPPAVWTPPPWAPPGPAPPSPRSRTPIYAAAGGVAVVVVILLVLAATGALPWFDSGSGDGPRSFNQARAESQPVANGYAGGPWTLRAAVEAVPGATMTIPINATIGGSNSTLGGTSGCTFNPLSAGSVTIPGSQNVSGGTSNEWVFLYTNTAGSALFVSDDAGTVQLVGTLSGSVCGTVFTDLSPIPSTVVDSTAAAATVGAAGGYAFLRAHPDANATAEVIGGLSFLGIAEIPGEWLFSYSTCPINLGGSTDLTASGEQFTANVSLTTGQLLGSQTSACGAVSTGGGGPTPLGSALTLGSPSDASAGASHWYNFTVEAAANSLPYDGVQFSVQNPAGGTVSLAAASVSAVRVAGGVVATFSLETGTWVSGGYDLFEAGDLLSLQTTTALAGLDDTLIVTGVPPYASGTLAISIP